MKWLCRFFQCLLSKCLEQMRQGPSLTVFLMFIIVISYWTGTLGGIGRGKLCHACQPDTNAKWYQCKMINILLFFSWIFQLTEAKLGKYIIYLTKVLFTTTYITSNAYPIRKWSNTHHRKHYCVHKNYVWFLIGTENKFQEQKPGMSVNRVIMRLLHTSTVHTLRLPKWC